MTHCFGSFEQLNGHVRFSCNFLGSWPARGQCVQMRAEGVHSADKHGLFSGAKGLAPLASTSGQTPQALWGERGRVPAHTDQTLGRAQHALNACPRGVVRTSPSTSSPTAARLHAREAGGKGGRGHLLLTSWKSVLSRSGVSDPL